MASRSDRESPSRSAAAPAPGLRASARSASGASRRPATPREATAHLEPFDWRRPSKFGREHVRALENAHDDFSRRLSSTMGSALRALVQVETVGVDQITYDDYVRSLPNPNVIGVLALPPLKGAAVMEMNAGFGLQIVDRMLGGRGLPVDLRRPTDLELPLLRDIMMLGVKALGEALRPLMGVAPELTLLETNSQMVQATTPQDMLLLLSFRLTIAQGEMTEGLLTLGYPASTLAPLLDRIAVVGGMAGEPAASREGLIREQMTERLSDVDVEVSARLLDSSVRAADLLSLSVGDVLRLDHRVGEPAVLHVGGSPVLAAHMGRRGRRLGVQVVGGPPPAAQAGDPPSDDASGPPAPTPHAPTPIDYADLRGAH